MKIGIITPRYPPNTRGGGEISVQLLAEHLSQNDRVEEVVVYTIDGNCAEVVNEVMVNRIGEISHKLIEYSNLRSASKIQDYIRLDIDVIHGYNMELHPVVGYISSKMDIPSVATLNSYRYFYKNNINVVPDFERKLYESVFLPTTGKILLYYIHKIDAFSVLSEASRNIYRQNGFGTERIEHIPNMVDPEFSVDENEVENASDSVEILYIGGLRPAKGVTDLVKAVQFLPPNYNLRIVGSGKLHSEIESRVKELNLTSSVNMVGAVPYERISSEYARADVFVHPGVWPEPGNRTTLEAMQAGLPVVCTDIGGPPELLPNRNLVCKPRNPREMAQKILQASEDREAIGAKNEAHVTGKYTPQEITSKFIDLYETTIQK